MKGMIYKIVVDGEIYIGSTKEKYLSDRQGKHNYALRNRPHTQGLYEFCLGKGIDKIKCEWVADIEFNNINELRTEEEKFRKELNATLNDRKCNATEEERKERIKKWGINNREKRNARNASSMIECPNCNIKMQSRSLERHLKNSCKSKKE
tara:strand:- start:482 stop:934 length:453 start_codon:yes stop_codon:yes gene_type:complete